MARSTAWSVVGGWWVVTGPCRRSAEWSVVVVVGGWGAVIGPSDLWPPALALCFLFFLSSVLPLPLFCFSVSAFRVGFLVFFLGTERLLASYCLFVS